MRVRKLASDASQNTAFGWSRDFLGNRFVYAVISQRAHGLSIGVNLNPEKYCNFKCVYCEVPRSEARHEQPVDINVMANELTKLLEMAGQDKLRTLPRFRKTPAELLQLKEVALSGDGEPTLCPNFEAVVEAVLRVRSQRAHFFKIVLITNTVGLFRPHVQHGWQQLTLDDEIWVKLDAGTQKYMERINQPQDATTLQDVTANILQIGRLRPIVIQSLFPMLDGEGPDADEIDRYIHRLQELRAGGAQITMVQVYSAHRPAQNPNCGHLPLNSLSAIVRRIRDQTRLKAEVF
jgi:wyosine [tRNA(Phe)-imidazoG37] synthetase (radical SAM superfamily)